MLIDTDGGGYVGRIGASHGWSTEDWVSGTTIDSSQTPGIQYQFTFGTFGDPRPLVGLAAGTYDMFIEAMDSAGNQKRTALHSFQVS